MFATAKRSTPIAPAAKPVGQTHDLGKKTGRKNLTARVSKPRAGSATPPPISAGDKAADEWVRSVLGDDLTPDEWPSPDEGRTGRELHWDAALLEADLAEMDRRPLPTLPTGLLCSHCNLAVVAVKVTKRWGRDWRDLCSRCRCHMVRTGHLPSRRANERHRRRLGM